MFCVPCKPCETSSIEYVADAFDDESHGDDFLQATNIVQPTKLVDDGGDDASVNKPLKSKRNSSRHSLLLLPHRGPAAEAFEVDVEKGSGMGIDVAKCKDGSALLVVRIKEGAVQDWNNAQAAADGIASVVRCGDRIVSVNGSGLGNAAEVLAALKSASGTVTLSIVRLVEFQVWNLSNLPRNNLGLEFEENEFGELVLTKVGPKANMALQQDVEIRPGDVIVKVNGNTEMLRSEIMSHNTLTLRIRRGEQPLAAQPQAAQPQVLRVTDNHKVSVPVKVPLHKRMQSASRRASGNGQA